MRNGLYSIHVDLLDGRSGKGSGVALFRDGKILGGDAYLFYVGTYASSGGSFKGEVTVSQHTPSPDANPLFGGQKEPVGIGVSGTSDGDAAVMTGTALVGKSSQLFRATLRRLADAD
ncbi:GrlR family regulatory protein [Rhodopseudomonas parapalustris]